MQVCRLAVRSLVERGMPNYDVFEPHPIVRLLEKPAAGFTCSDLVRAVEQLELRQVNLRYVGGDGRLKTVAFPINSREHLIEVLTRGERVGALRTTTDIPSMPVRRPR